MSAAYPGSSTGRRHDPASSADESAQGRATWSHGMATAAPSRLVNTHPTPAAFDDDAESEPMDPKSSDESPEGRLLWAQGRVTSVRSSPGYSPRYQRPSTTAASTSEVVPTSSDERAEGRALWSHPSRSSSFDDGAIMHEKSPAAQDLLDTIQTKLFARYDSLHASFLKIDVDRSGYISDEEFRLCMANLGLDMSDEEVDLLRQSYPHKEAAGEADKGMGYLEFVNVMTDQLQYIPGSGEDEGSGNYFRLTTEDNWPIRGQVSGTADVVGIQKKIHRQVFGLTTSLKDAFKAADRDGSGYIELPEFIRLLQVTLDMGDIDKGQARGLLHKFDTNGDGTLAYSEFVKCLQSTHR